MTTITDKQLAKLIRRYRAQGYADVPADDIRLALGYLAAALNAGLVLNSGDGFFYSLQRKNGRLYAHDGAELRGTLWHVISEYVWSYDAAAAVALELCDLWLPTWKDDKKWDDACTLAVSTAIFDACGNACPPSFAKVKG